MIEVPFNPLDRVYQAYRPAFDEAVARVLRNGRYLSGPEVTRFEDAFANWCGVEYCVGVASGTDAVAIALMALGIGAGDAVFTVSHTAVATVAAIEMTGARPVLVDVGPQTLTLDPDALVETLRDWDDGERPAAVVAVHLYGNPCDLDRLRAVCDQYGLKLVEDCAQAHGATWRGRPVGGFGDAGAFSFYPTKTLGAFGDAGAVVTGDPEVAERARLVREYGWDKRRVSTVGGINSRLDELQAAILSVRLPHLDDEIGVRRALAKRYDRALPDGVTVPSLPENGQSACHLYVVLVPARDALADHLRRNHVQTAIHYPRPVHWQPAFAALVDGRANRLPVTDRLCGCLLSLPFHPFIEEEETVRVIKALADFE